MTLTNREASLLHGTVVVSDSILGTGHWDEILQDFAKKGYRLEDGALSVMIASEIKSNLMPDLVPALKREVDRD